MINNLIRKFLTFPSLFFKNKKINLRKDKKIFNEIKDLIESYKLNYSTLNKTHKIFNDELLILFKKKHIRNFLRENFIQKMFFVHNRIFIFKELKALKQNKNWPFYKKLIKEDNIGNPVRYFLYPKSSGNRINHVFHLSILKDEMGINVKNIKNIFEFGAGYGCMARIFSKINRKIKYLCFDTFLVNVLQFYYLKHNNLDVGFDEGKNNFLLASNIKKLDFFYKKNKNYLFIANWSLSETPLKFRKNVTKFLINSKYILICFQENFENINNLRYFKNLKFKLSKKYKIKIIKNNFYTGNILFKQNHYFFLAKRKI